MNVKKLKELVAAIPEELNGAPVYSYVSICEDADDAYGVKVYHKPDPEDELDEDEAPYLSGDSPWEDDEVFVIIG